MRPELRSSKRDPLESALSRLVGSPDPHRESANCWDALFDVKETPGEMTVLVDLPGVDEDELSIGVNDHTLKISAERNFDHDNEDAEEYIQLGRPYGVLGCSVVLPPTAVPDEMTAKYRRGVLKVRIPLKPNANHRRIPN